MKLNERADIYIPDGIKPVKAVRRTTLLGIGAHQDDLELMALDGILKGYKNADEWFTGVTCTNGGGCPRVGIYEKYTDEEMQEIRLFEQREAGEVGEYASVIQLRHPSSAVKEGEQQVVDDLTRIIKETKPRMIYTHNLADKHDTHVAVVKRTIEALRSLPGKYVPEKLYGCEVWRGLDWLPDEEKIVFDVSEDEPLNRRLLRCFESQLVACNYMEAAIGRQKANATFFETHEGDAIKRAIYAMDLTPLVLDPNVNMEEFVDRKIEGLDADVRARMTKF